MSPESNLEILGWELGLALQPKTGLGPLNQLLRVGGIKPWVLWPPRSRALEEGLLSQPLSISSCGWDGTGLPLLPQPK